MKITRNQLREIIKESLGITPILAEAVEKFPLKSNQDSDYQDRINKFYDEFGGAEEAGDLYIPDYVPYDDPGAELPDLRFKVSKQVSYPADAMDGTRLNTFLIELYDNQEGRTTFLLVPYAMLTSQSVESSVSDTKDITENYVTPAEYPQNSTGGMKEIPIDGQVYVPKFAQRSIQSAISRNDRSPYDSGFEFIGMAPPPNIPGGAQGGRCIGIQNYSDPDRPEGYYQDIYLRMSDVVIRDKKTGKQYQVPFDQGTFPGRR